MGYLHKAGDVSAFDVVDVAVGLGTILHALEPSGSEPYFTHWA